MQRDCQIVWPNPHFDWWWYHQLLGCVAVHHHHHLTIMIMIISNIIINILNLITISIINIIILPAVWRCSSSYRASAKMHVLTPLSPHHQHRQPHHQPQLSYHQQRQHRHQPDQHQNSMTAYFHGQHGLSAGGKGRSQVSKIDVRVWRLLVEDIFKGTCSIFML